MTDVMLIAGIYLLLGGLFLVLLEATTHRVSQRLRGASREAQVDLVNSGVFVEHKTATALTFVALWLFWPVALYGAIETKLKKSQTKGEK